MARLGNIAISEGTRARIERAVPTLAWLAVAFYLAQHWALAPNHTDDGLILTYIDDMAGGTLPYWDFVDAYGIFNWVLPVLAYVLAGKKVWGIRVFLLLLKLFCVGLAYRLVRRASSRLYAVLAAVLLAVLFGQPWQSVQTAYAFSNVVPLVLGTWWLILFPPLADRRHNVIAASALTTLAIWTKLNTGMFLFAGGLFAYFYWVPDESSSASTEAGPDRGVRWFKVARLAGLGAYAALFGNFIRVHFNAWFFAYLLLPLLFALVVTGVWVLRGDDRPARFVRSFGEYLVTTVALSLFVWFGYYRGHAFDYARELSAILSAVDYTATFPEFGRPGLYVGLAEFYWLQLPWLVTAAFACWVLLSARFGARTFGSEWPRRRATVMSLFVFFTLHAFVMYARCDETHIFQALLLLPPVLFVLFFQLERFLLFDRESRARYARLATAVAIVAYASTIAVVPTLDALRIHEGDWHSPHLAHLRYRPLKNPYVKDYSEDITDYEWDAAEDATAEYIDSVTKSDEEILVLTSNRLMHLNSNTKPIGGRKHYYFYLLSVKLIDPFAFRRLVGDDIIRDILLHPPRVIVDAIEQVPPITEVAPGIRWLMDKWYVKTRVFRHILVYEPRARVVRRKPTGPIILPY